MVDLFLVGMIILALGSRWGSSKQMPSTSLQIGTNRIGLLSCPFLQAGSSVKAGYVEHAGDQCMFCLSAWFTEPMWMMERECCIPVLGLQ